MLYCAKCSRLVEGGKCLGCRSAKRIREVRPDDPVLLIIKEALWSGGIEEALRGNGIPCLKVGEKGAAMAAYLGSVSEVYRFYVRYDDLPKAKALLEIE